MKRCAEAETPYVDMIHAFERSKKYNFSRISTVSAFRLEGSNVASQNVRRKMFLLSDFAAHWTHAPELLHRGKNTPCVHTVFMNPPLPHSTPCTSEFATELEVLKPFCRDESQCVWSYHGLAQPISMQECAKLFHGKEWMLLFYVCISICEYLFSRVNNYSNVSEHSI